MSSEQSINQKAIETPNGALASNVQEKPPTRVDINNLLHRVREKEKLQKKENLLFCGIVGSVIVITGVIASL